MEACLVRGIAALNMSSCLRKRCRKWKWKVLPGLKDFKLWVSFQNEPLRGLGEGLSSQVGWWKWISTLGLEINDTFLSLLYFYPKQPRSRSYIFFHVNLLKGYLWIRYDTNIIWPTASTFVIQFDISNKHPMTWGLLPGLCVWSQDLHAVSGNKSHCSVLS